MFYLLNHYVLCKHHQSRMPHKHLDWNSKMGIHYIGRSMWTPYHQSHMWLFPKLLEAVSQPSMEIRGPNLFFVHKDTAWQI